MSDYPPQVERFRRAILDLPGVSACDVGLKNLEEIDAQTVSLPGEYADLPQVAIYRTGGGRENELLIHAEIRFGQSRAGWVALEFLAWWVRDQARGGEVMQLRAVALPPEGYERQLGRTLKFELEIFRILESEDLQPVLDYLEGLGNDIAESIEIYADAIEDPVEPEAEPEEW